MTNCSKGMEFGRGILEKYGWKEGQGLGRNEDGVTKILKPVLKFDSAGVGYEEASKEFTSRWWEQSYNEVAKSIEVTRKKADVKIKQKDRKDLFKSRGSRPVSMYTTTDYNSFVKTSLLTGEGVMESLESESDAVATPEEDVASAAPSSLTDEEIFRVCGGRTVHKGARHGLKLSGKLARIQRQEELLRCQLREATSCVSDNTNLVEGPSSSRKPEHLNIVIKDATKNIEEGDGNSLSGEKQKKKKKKKKHSSSNLHDYDLDIHEAKVAEFPQDECNEVSSTVSMVPDSTSFILPLESHIEPEGKKSKRKKKKKKKRDSEKYREENEKTNECEVTSSLFPESEKKRKRKRDVDVDERASWAHSADGGRQRSASPVLSSLSPPFVISCQNEVVATAEMSGESLIKKHKKRKHKS